MVLPQIDTYLEQHLERYIEEVAELCAQPSVSARTEGTHECAELVAKVLARHGLEVQIFPTAGSPVVFGYLQGTSERTLLCYNHYDVQPPEPLDLWTTPPFEPTVRDGALYARGARDDKGEIVARLAAIDALREVYGGTLPCSVKFVIEGEEEIGSPHIAQFVQEHLDLLKCHGAIWEEGGIGPDGTHGMPLGCRGVLAVELTVETMRRDAHSGSAHVLPNAAWRLVRLLNLLKDEDEHILIDGFYADVLAPSALDLEISDGLPTFEEMYQEQYGLTEFVLGRSGTAIHRAVFEPTCNIQGITTGYQGAGTKTVIPSRASVKIDFRLVPRQNPDDIERKLRSFLDAQGFADVQITRLGAMFPYKSAPDNPFVRLTSDTAQTIYGAPSRIVPLSGGSSPVYAFNAPLGDIPVVTAGVGYWDNRAHAPNEHMRFQDFLNAARHIALILDGFGTIGE